MDSQIQALLRERDGYVLRGLSNRVAAVDAELKRLGYKPPAEVETSDRPRRSRKA